MTKKIVIVGGVAGGATVAARLRRLDEECSITVHERGGYVSFANCGLPYHIGGEIPERDRLLLHTPESLKERFALDVRVRSEVVAIDRIGKHVTALNLVTGKTTTEPYDVLVLSPGAAPLRPTIPGLDLPGIYSLRDLHDMDRIVGALTARAPREVVVVGGGFIGLEMVEQLHRRLGEGVGITLIEGNPHVLGPLDAEMAVAIEDELIEHGIRLQLGDPVAAFERSGDGLSVRTKNGKAFHAEFVLFNIGVRPETALAKQAGLEIGARGGIRVDSTLRTSDPSIFALGDCIETPHLVTGESEVIPLAGPANRQGRIVADVICGRDSNYRGTLGTAIVRIFNLTAAVTGANERTLRRLGISHQSAYLHPGSHAGYFPGAKPIHLKLLFSPETGKILGAQAVGEDGVDKRIDVIATAISAGLTIDALIDLELCYAPPFGSAKDPVNVAGMVAQNIKNHTVETVSPAALERERGDSLLLDVRDEDERERGTIPGSIHIPLSELRGRLSEVSKDRSIIVFCQSGQRSYIACRILSQRGYRCRNLSGAFKSWKAAHHTAAL